MSFWSADRSPLRAFSAVADLPSEPNRPRPADQCQTNATVKVLPTGDNDLRKRLICIDLQAGELGFEPGFPSSGSHQRDTGLTLENQ
jgi:hypothetical protein